MSDHNHTNTTMTEMEEMTASVETIKPLDDDPIETNRCPPDVIPKVANIGRQTVESNEFPVAARATMQAEAVNSSYMIEEEAVSNSPAIKVENHFSIGFDDIELADDVKMCCIEKREPNGKVYFIEIDLNESPPNQTNATATIDCERKNNSFGDDVIIQEMVDKVLFKSDRGDQLHESTAVDRKVLPARTENDAVSEDETEIEDAEIETRAIVHTIIDLKEVELAAAADTEPMPMTGTKPFFTFGAYESPSNRCMEQSTSGSIGHSKDFKDRLARLLGQFGEEPTKSTTPIERKRSISVPDHINTTSMTAGRRPSLKLLVADGSKNDIPAAPKFDQMMYDTIGRRMKIQHNQIQVPATAQSIENEFAKSFNQVASSSSHLHRTKKSDDLMKLLNHESEADGVEAASVLSIRERLNEIYGRGRPSIAVFAEEKFNVESNSRRESDEGIQLRKPIKPYDTVHKQKQLFSDVLKSINPEVRNSLHRTESIASADVQAVTHKD